MSEKISKLIEKAVIARENGDYKTGLEGLEKAYTESRKANSPLVAEAGNHLSIQYRLLAGRYARQEQLQQAEKYADLSLNVYEELETLNLFDKSKPFTQRNYAHALLYAGYVNQAIPELIKSIEIQTELKSKGDELCHLAAAKIVEQKYEEAAKLVSEGLELLKQNDGSKIAITFGLMTKATIEFISKESTDATSTLEEALKLAETNKLMVRIEEINYLINDSNGINVLKAVSGELINLRKDKKYGK